MRTKLPDLELLRMFCTAGKLKYLNLTADELGVTPSAVSQAIRRLEEHFGAELFQRDQRPLQLTPIGRRLLRDGLPIVQAAQTLESNFRDIDLSQVSLRLGLGESITATLSPWIISTVHSKVADLQVVSMLNMPLTAKLKSSELDVCIYSEALLSESQWCRVPLYEENYLLASSMHLPKVSSVQELRELAFSRPYVCYTPEGFDRNLTDRFLRNVGIEPRTRIQINSSYCVVGLVSMVNGWAILPPTNLWCGGQFATAVRFSALPTDERLFRRMWAVGHPRFETETRWLGGLTKELFKTHTLTELGQISKEITAYARILD